MNLTYVKDLSSPLPLKTSLVGGKASSLNTLIQADINVPPGFVITTNCYVDFNTKTIPPEVKEEIYKAFDNLKTKKVAIRSSATAEDSPNNSWAGQFDTFLNVTKNNLLNKLLECWKSICSERALAYSANKNLKGNNLKIAVVVQKMIKSNISGIMFTVNPVNKNVNEAIIEIGCSQEESLAEGKITPETFIIDKHIFEITKLKKSLQKNIGRKNKFTLDSNQIKILTKLGIKIENFFSKPQDIEFCLDEKGKIWILQARPITTL